MTTKNDITAVTSFISLLLTIILGLPPFLEYLSNVTIISEGNDNKYDFLKNQKFAVIAIIEVLLLIVTLYIFNSRLYYYYKDMDLSVKIETNINRLKRSVNLIFITWIILYMWLFLNWYFDILNYFKFSRSIVWSVADALHALNGIYFFISFYYIINPIKYVKQLGPFGQAAYLYNRRYKLWLKKISIITICCLLFSIWGRCYIIFLDKFGVVLLCFWCAISMQYFLSAFSRINFDKNYCVLMPLYIYILLQITWPVVDFEFNGDSNKTIILILALFCKLYLLYIIYLRFKDGSIINHFKKRN